jgi:PAS domain S-box-containing protein
MGSRVKAAEAHLRGVGISTLSANVILEKLREPFFIADHALKIIYVNPAGERALGKKKDNILGSTFTEIFAGKAGSLINNAVKKAYGQKRKVKKISVFSGLEGRIDATIYPVDEGMTVSLSIDKGVKEKELPFIEQITQTSPFLIGITDLVENKFIYVNKAATELFGYTSEEFSRMGNGTWTALVYPDDLHILKQLFANVVASNETQHAVYRVKRKDGVYRWLSNRAAVFKKDEHGRATQILSIAYDETDNKIAEIGLRESQVLLEAIFNSSTSGIEVYKAVRDDKGEITDFECMLANKATERYLRRNDLAGKRLREEYPQVVPAGIFDMYKKVVEESIILDTEHYYENETGGYWFHRVGVKMNDGLVVTWEDITHRKKTQERHTMVMVKQQKDQARAVLVAQEEERKRIAEALHNELGQLLYITKLKVADNSREESVKLLEAAIDQVRTISFELMPGILRDFGLETALKDLARKKLAELEIRYSLQIEGLRKRPSSALEMAIFRMIQELLNNVVKHAKASHVNIEVANAGRNIVIKVEDNGIGFTRQASSRNKGFGLGSIENRIELLNGTFEITSAPGGGTKVFISVPVRSSKAR